MKQRLSSAYRDHGSSHRPKTVDSAEHLIERHRLREVIEFIAVCARQIAPPHWNDVDQQRMLCGGEALRNHAELAHLAMSREQLLPDFLLECHRLPGQRRLSFASPELNYATRWLLPVAPVAIEVVFGNLAAQRISVDSKNLG